MRVLAGSHDGFLIDDIVQQRSARRSHRMQQLHRIAYAREARFVGWQGARPVGGPVRKRTCDRYQRKKMNLPGHVLCRPVFEAWLFLGQALFTHQALNFCRGASHDSLGTIPNRRVIRVATEQAKLLREFGPQRLLRARYVER